LREYAPDASGLLAACGSDNPVSLSQPVGIFLPVQSKDVAAGMLAPSKNINTESGNPYRSPRRFGS